MTARYTVTLLQEAVADLRRLEDFAIERELASETPDWTTPQRALDVLSEGMRLLSWSPYSCRRLPALKQVSAPCRADAHMEAFGRSVPKCATAKSCH